MNSKSIDRHVKILTKHINISRVYSATPRVESPIDSTEQKWKRAVTVVLYSRIIIILRPKRRELSRIVRFKDLRRF